MIKVFYAPICHKKTTEFLFKDAISSEYRTQNTEHRIYDYSNILYLSPASVKTKEAQKIFHQLITAKCYIPPEIATIRQYCKKLYSTYGDKRILDKSLIPIIMSRLSDKSLGFSSVASDFISDLKQMYPDTDINTMIEHLIDIFRELNIPEAVTKTAMDSLEMFKEYELFIKKAGLIDKDDVLRESYKLQVASYKLLIIDGFYNLTHAEKNVLRALLRHSEQTFVLIPYDSQFIGLLDEYIHFLKDNFDVEEIYLKEGQGSSASGGVNGQVASFVYYSYPSIEEEVEGIAKNIKSLYTSGRFQKLEEIAVAFPDLNKYYAVVERVFNRYGIPYDISNKRSLMKIEPFLDLICFLKSVEEGYPRLKFSQFLSSRYFSKVPESLKKWIPTLSLCSGIVSGRSSWIDFIAEGSEILDMSLVKERAVIERDLKWVFKKLQPIDNIKNSAFFDTYTSLFKKLLDEFGFMGFPLDASTKNLQKKTKELLEQLFFIGSLHSTTASLSEFVDVLIHILNVSYIETEGKGVRIMDFSDVPELSPQYIYFGGLTDGDMPRRLEMDILLPDSVKKRLGFLNLDKYIDIQRFNFYRAITSCSNVHLSYPSMDDDDMFLPSPFLYFGKEAKEKIPGIFSKEEYLVRNGKIPFSSYISEIETSQLPTFNFQPTTSIRVTDVDAYRACPRRFFIERILSLSPASVKEYEIEAATIGTIIHRIMEQIIKEPFEDIEYLMSRSGIIIEEAMRGRRIDAFWKRLIKDTFIEILPDIYEKEIEIRKNGYILTDVEKNIAGEPIKGIKLKGKIDRIDRIGDSVQIIDYKTGTAGLNCKQVFVGNENMQLFLYAAMLKNQGYTVSRVGIYSMKDIDIKWCPPSKSVKRQASSVKECTTLDARLSTIDDYIIASLRFLDDAVKKMRKGDFKAKPLNDYICWNCHEYPFCPYIQQ